ncbi:MAG TPA: GGDEF domain-containing protein [Longimicrobiales bacterium]
MRGVTNPATARAPELTHRQRRVLAGAALALLTGVFLTGGTASPLLLPLVATLVAMIRYAAHPLELTAPFVAGLLLALFETLAGAGTDRGFVGGLLLLAGTIPGWIWRAEASRTADRLAQLDDILAQARRGQPGEAPSAAEDLAELARALAAVAERLGARQIRIWDVEVHRGFARARAAASGRAGQTVRLIGDPLGWVWEQGIRMRLDAAPRWAEQGTVTIADRLRQRDDDGQLVTYDFDPARLPVDDPSLEQAAVYLRGVLALQEDRSTAAAVERRVAALLAGLREMPNALDLDELGAELCQTAMRMTEATGAALASWDGQRGHVIAVAGADGGPSPGDEFVPPESELALAARAGDMLVRDAASWSIGKTTLAASSERWIHRPRCLATLPLLSPAGTSGVLAVWSSNAAAFDSGALDMLRALAPFAALNMEHAHEFGSIRLQADRDPLTQLRNRRAFDVVFESESGRFTRHGRPLALLVIDLDHFKSINDQHGHEAGDEALIRTARVIEANIRDIDTAARFGGEEFVVLLSETGIRAALEVAERIRAAVARAEVEFKGRSIPIRASIGVSACPESVALPGGLIASADAALYRAKAGGRNRVVAASG